MKRAYRRAEKFNGDPCIHGHGTLRYRSCGGCVDCILEAAQAKRDAFKRAGKTYRTRALKSEHWAQWLLSRLRRELPRGTLRLGPRPTP